MATVYERYEAIVTRLEDEFQVGRVFVKCPGLTGDEDTELPDPIDPVMDWSIFWIPDIGEEIEIEVLVSDDQEEGVPNQAFIEEPRMRWRGKRFRSEEGEAPRPPHNLFTDVNYGKRRGIGTPAGHILMFDDTEESREILLAWRKTTDGEEYSQMQFDKDGSIEIKTYNGNIVKMNAVEGEEGITATDFNANEVKMDKDGIKATDLFGNYVELKDGQLNVFGVDVVNIESTGDCNVTVGGNLTADITGNAVINCVDANLNATGNYTLGDGADSPLVRWTELNAWLDAHTHPTAFGPSGPPIVPSVGMGIDSAKGSLV